MHFSRHQRVYMRFSHKGLITVLFASIGLIWVGDYNFSSVHYIAMRDKVTSSLQSRKHGTSFRRGQCQRPVQERTMNLQFIQKQTGRQAKQHCQYYAFSFRTDLNVMLARQERCLGILWLTLLILTYLLLEGLLTVCL